MTDGFSPKNRIALLAVCLSAMMLGLEITSVPSILPTLEHVLPADFRQLQWIMNAYTIAMCAVLMAAGTLGDRVGRKRIFIAGIIVFGFASLVCGIASSAPLLIAARFLQGVSAAAMLACQVAILSHQFRDGAERGRAFGMWGIVFGVGLGFGPIVGGAIITLASWHWVFLIHVLIAIATLICARRGVEESLDPTPSPIDFVGMVTLSAGVFGIVYLITQGSSNGFAEPMSLAILAASVASLLLFVVTELRVQRPMFDFSAFKVREFSGALLGSSGMNFSFWPFVIYLPIFLQASLGYSAVVAGLTVLAYTLPTIVAPPLAERLLLSKGPRFVIPLGLSVIGLGFALLAAVIQSGDATWASVLPGCLIAGLGLGLTNTPVTNTATAALPPERAGMAGGMDMSARMISLAVNIAVMGFILVTGVLWHLNSTVPHLANDIAIRGLADAIAGGNTAAIDGVGQERQIAQDALAHGITWVTIYGAACAWVLAVASLWTFGKRSKTTATPT